MIQENDDRILREQRDELLAALELAINTVECASIDIRTGEDLPWYKMAKKAVANARRSLTS